MQNGWLAMLMLVQWTNGLCDKFAHRKVWHSPFIFSVYRNNRYQWDNAQIFYVKNLMSQQQGIVIISAWTSKLLILVDNSNHITLNHHFNNTFVQKSYILYLCIVRGFTTVNAPPAQSYLIFQVPLMSNKNNFIDNNLWSVLISKRRLALY